jgi:hypothetical protein
VIASDGTVRREMTVIGGTAMKVRLGAVSRGAGVAVGSLVSRSSARSSILFVAYAAGWLLDKPGLQVFVIVPDTEEPWKRATVPFATSVGSWSAAMLAAMAALRRTRLPTPIAAVALGGAVVVVDSLLADLAEAREGTVASHADDEASSASRPPPA